jgi:hypothetical protein
LKSGNSTVLGAAAFAYKTVMPGDFFRYRMSALTAWRIDYDIIDPSINKGGVLRRYPFSSLESS